jgi:hypothetical protein
MARAIAACTAVLLCCITMHGSGQQDPIQKEAAEVRELTHARAALHLEERTRWEEHYGNSFGKAKNQQDMLSRLRISMDYSPTGWLLISAMGQDARAPWYGQNAPGSLRDSIDLNEAFIEIRKKNRSMSASIGRRMLNYGETRVIGVPQWSNTSRTYDFGRVQFTTRHFALETLMASPVIVRPDMFNNPELGNRYWGTYDVLPKIWHGTSIDIYALRHSQNKVGGWTSNGTLGTNNFGTRFYGPLPAKLSYSLEGIGQTGHVGSLNQRAYAWFAGLNRTFPVNALLIDTSVEFKEASGSHAGSTHSSTFDQLSPANHDKFGHQDLFGWKNLRTFKTLETIHPTKASTFNVMYTNHSLFSASDSLYASSGSKIATSAHGTAGRAVGQELDGFATYSWGAHTFFAGVGYFFRGQFVVNTTSGINPRYFYIAQQYNIK